tara:strand:- start:150 stop:500 length:351 start_codon:yes stop_codon:yes gene_type:complete
MDIFYVLLFIFGVLFAVPFIGFITYVIVKMFNLFVDWVQLYGDEFMVKKYISELKKSSPELTPKELEEAEEKVKVNRYHLHVVPAWYEAMVIYVMSWVIGLGAIGLMAFYAFVIIE